jgi:NAD-dependent SIR2 family protein deacetylase
MVMNDEILNKKIEKTVKWIINSNHLVAFTGAGISTESGIPDFRGPNGVWTRRDKGLPPPKPTKPWTEIAPNKGHYALNDLYQMGLLKFVITQNTDNLHRQSGIKTEDLAELHGNGKLLICFSCEKKMTYQEARWDKSLLGPGYRTHPIQPNQPKCPYCQGRLMSSVVNFGDPLPEKDYKMAYEHSEDADVYLIVGSSLVVYPAADLPIIAKKNGAKLILINIGETPLDRQVDIKIEQKIGQVLTAIVTQVKELIDVNR